MKFKRRRKGCLLKRVCIQLSAIAEVSPFSRSHLIFLPPLHFFFLYLSYNYKLILGIEPAKVPKDAKQKKKNKRSYQPLNNNQTEERANERQKKLQRFLHRGKPQRKRKCCFPCCLTGWCARRNVGSTPL